MNRQIKFRAWSVENKRWANIRHSLVEQCNLPRMDGYFSFEDIFYDGSYIFQQFTGLLDKNGHEIYEGDIIQHKNGIGPIVFSPFNAGFVIDANGLAAFDDKHGLYWLFHRDNAEYYKVIGNIHENPDLLK